MRVAPGAALIAPVAGLDQPLDVSATIAAHPRRLGLAEGVKAYECQPVIRLAPALRAALGARQAERSQLGAGQEMLEVAAVLELEQAVTGVVDEMRCQPRRQILTQLQHARVFVLRGAQPCRELLRLDVLRQHVEAFAPADAGVEQQEQVQAELGIDLLGLVDVGEGVGRPPEVRLLAALGAFRSLDQRALVAQGVMQHRGHRRVELAAARGRRHERVDRDRASVDLGLADLAQARIAKCLMVADTKRRELSA